MFFPVKPLQDYLLTCKVILGRDSLSFGTIIPTIPPKSTVAQNLKIKNLKIWHIFSLLKGTTMRYFLFAALLAGGGTMLCAQSPENRSVVAAQGGSDQNASVQLAWTLGDPATAAGASESAMLTEGFQQQVLTLIKIPPDVELDQALDRTTQSSTAGVITLFPNPTAGTLRISTDADSNAPIQITLTDMNGRLLAEHRLERPPFPDLDLAPYPPGAYLLHIQSEDGKFDDTYRVIRH